MEQEKKPKLTPVFTLFETALKIWWKNLKKIIGIYFWGILFALIPLVIVFVFYGLATWLGTSLTLGFKIGAVIISVIGVLLAFYFFIRAYMGVFLLVKKDFQGNELAIFKETKKLFWPYIGLTLLTTIFVLLWTLLLIIPGIIYSVFYCFAVYVFFFEEKRGMAAIRRSVRLVSNYWWPVFGRIIVVSLIVWVFTVLISIPLSFAPEHSVFAGIWSVVVQVISFLIGPIVLLFSYLIYQDLVKIKK